MIDKFESIKSTRKVHSQKHECHKKAGNQIVPSSDYFRRR